MKGVIEFYRGVRKVVSEAEGVFDGADARQQLLDELTKLYIGFLEARITHEEDQ